MVELKRVGPPRVAILGGAITFHMGPMVLIVTTRTIVGIGRPCCRG